MLTQTIPVPAVSMPTTGRGANALPLRIRERRLSRSEHPAFSPLRLSDARHVLDLAVARLDDRHALATLGALEHNGEVLGEVRVGLRQGYLDTGDLHDMIRWRVEALLMALQQGTARQVTNLPGRSRLQH